MRPSLVIDASVALAWCFADEASEGTQGLLRRMSRDAAAVPSLWFIELANALAVAERKGRIQSHQTADFIRLIGQLDLEVDDHTEPRIFHYVLDLARTHQLSAYDATYLDLARRFGLPLATFDANLRRAAEASGVSLLTL